MYEAAKSQSTIGLPIEGMKMSSRSQRRPRPARTAMGSSTRALENVRVDQLVEQEDQGIEPRDHPDQIGDGKMSDVTLGAVDPVHGLI